MRDLVGRNLVLRPFEESDIDERYLSWLADREVVRYLEVGHSRIDRASAVRYLARFRESQDEIYLIVERASGRSIGTVTLNGVEHVHRTADTGLLIGERDRWGLGYASQAWTLIIAHAFAELRLRKVIAGVCSGHERSLAVLLRLGFKLEGRLRGQCLVDGEHIDTLRMGMFQDEFVPHPHAFPVGVHGWTREPS